MTSRVAFIRTGIYDDHGDGDLDHGANVELRRRNNLAVPAASSSGTL